MTTLLLLTALLAPPDEAVIQGLYEGTAAGKPVEARVVAMGKGVFHIHLRHDLLKRKVAFGLLKGRLEGEKLAFTGKAGETELTGSYSKGSIRGPALRLERIYRKPPTLGKQPPKGAIVLLDGENFGNVSKREADDPWKPGKDGSIEVPKGGLNSKEGFEGSFRLHVEFRCNLRASARGQGRGNSGVYLPNGDEIQVLDSFGVETYTGGGCGGLYRYKDPDAFDVFSLASLPPLYWQTYDVEYRVPDEGNPRLTVRHNGITIHDNVELRKKARKGGFHFQDHGNPVRYRNIWVVPIK